MIDDFQRSRRFWLLNDMVARSWFEPGLQSATRGDFKVSRHRHDGRAGDLAEFQAASIFWRSQVATQGKLIVLVGVATLLSIASASYPWGAGPPPLSEALEEMTITGGMSSEQALMITTLLAALVGALSVALVVAPKVDDERTLVDRLALARWGQSITRLNAVTAGVCLGISVAQFGGPPSPVSSLMLIVALIICAVAATSIQRLHDTIHGQLATAAVVQLEEALDRLSKDAPVALDRSRRRDLAQSLASYTIYPVTLLLVALGIDAHYLTSSEFYSWPHAASGLNLLVVATMVGAFLTAPWQMVLRWRMRRRVFSQQWRRWWWLLGSPSGLLTVLVLLLPFQPPEPWSVRLGLFAYVLVPPVVIGIVLASLGLRAMGPWSESWRVVDRVLHQEFTLASQRAHSLLEAAGK